MFIRLLILAICAVVIYRVLRSWLQKSGGKVGGGSDGFPDRVDDVMIKDPVCGAYFPQRKGVALSASDDVLYFCCTACRDSYLAKQSGNDNG